MKYGDGEASHWLSITIIYSIHFISWSLVLGVLVSNICWTEIFKIDFEYQNSNEDFTQDFNNSVLVNVSTTSFIMFVCKCNCLLMNVFVIMHEVMFTFTTENAKKISICKINMNVT